MLLSRGRMAYLGFLGRPQKREFGALTVYVSLASPFRIRVGEGGWETARMFVVAPETPHQISSSDRMIAAFLIELETISVKELPTWLQPSANPQQREAEADRLRQAFLAFHCREVDAVCDKDHFDHHFFGGPLQQRELDPRVVTALDLIDANPCVLVSAEDCAERVSLSVSRFLHLFKESLGTTFRRFRAWKRARTFLSYLNASSSLTDIALDIGYPDSSHFSHTVRYCWGLTPQNMVAGSRGLNIFNHCRVPFDSIWVQERFAPHGATVGASDAASRRWLSLDGTTRIGRATR